MKWLVQALVLLVHLVVLFLVVIVGAFNIPLIHLSVVWFRSLHPEPVVLQTEGAPQLPGDMLATLMIALVAFTFLFLALFLLRYGVAQLEARAEQAAPTPTI